MKPRRPKPPKGPKNTSWGSVAKQYHQNLKEDDSYQQAVILPRLLEALGEITGKRIIDIGCGEGLFARELTLDGAQVTGADIAPEMIELAQQRSPQSIPFHVAPSDKLSFASDQSFDLALIVLAIQNIERMEATFKECRRLLVTGGELVMVLNHPVLRIPKRSSWGWDTRGNQYRRLDAYLSERSEKMDMDPGKTDQKRFTLSFHRPLQTYVHALKKNGFLISGLEEWISHKKSQTGPRAEAEDRARKEFPMFMMLRAQKVVS